MSARGIPLAVYQVHATLSQIRVGVGVPHLVLAGGTPSLSWSGVTPSSPGWGGGIPPGTGWGTPPPHLVQAGYPLPTWDLGLDGVPPGKDMGPVEILWDGYGVAPCEQTVLYCSVKAVPSPSVGKSIVHKLLFILETTLNNSNNVFPITDRMALFVMANVHGHDERGRLMRRTIMRYLCLAHVITLSSISTAVKKRFPTFQHMTEAGNVHCKKVIIAFGVPEIYNSGELLHDQEPGRQHLIRYITECHCWVSRV